MKTLGVLALLALAAMVAPAADKDGDTPGFADGWRLSGILKQGDKLQASMEHSSHTPRFVVEGGELVPGARVEKIDATARAVTVRKGNLIAIIRSGSSPAVVRSSPMAAQTSPQSSASPSAPPPEQPQPPQFPQVTAKAGQDEGGRWGIRLSDGQFFSAQDYATRYGGAEQAIAHLNNRLASDLPPERKILAQQMLTALQNSQSAQSPAGGGSASGNAAVVSTTVSVSPATGQRGAAPAPEEPAGFQDPGRVFRRGPQLRR
ncbi:MAG: hypothetical protein NTY01_15385 [Verrucomicrobia bacterium]|nr:hypothetical protein [Verrucomicrobiota bacterium]